MILFEKAKKRLAILWFLLSGFIILLMIYLVNGKLVDFSNKAWNWLLPNIFPTLTLILTVFVTDFQNSRNENGKQVKKFYFRLSFYLSLVYLSIIIGILLSPIWGYNILKVIEGSNLYLGPIQGLVAASLGFFFFNNNS
jgi:hypothetical protein